MNFNKNIFGFTLAEVLITLGIIGVVAALTIPTLMNYYAKNSTVTKLQKFYTNMSQAIKLSEIDNSDHATWTYPALQDATSMKAWFDKYLANYIKSTTTEISSYWYRIYFLDGSVVALARFNTGEPVQMYYYVNGLSKTTMGKDVFIFLFSPELAFPLYGFNGNATCSSTTGRNFYTCDPTFGCTSSGGKQLCAGLIMYDGWQIKSDYPYFN